MNILFLSRWYPYPPNNGSKLRIYNLLRAITVHHRITLVSFAEPGEGALPDDPLESLCAEVQIVPLKAYQPASRRALLGYFSLTPRWLLDTHSLEMAECITHKLSDKDYDLVIASQISMAVYGQHFEGVPAILEEVETGVIYQKFVDAPNVWKRMRHGLTWFKYRVFITRLLKRFRACTVASATEQQIIVKMASNRTVVTLIPNCIDLSSYTEVDASPQPNTIIFTGSFRYFANHEAMVWFIRDVMPLIQAVQPDVRLMITGDTAGLPIPTNEGVILTGQVEDVRTLIASSWVSIVPILVGGGTRLKILEAMALRTPVVATSKGAEGMNIRSGEHLLVADSAEEFARAIIRLLSDASLRQSLTEYAYELVKREYNVVSVAPLLLDLIAQAARSG